MEIKILGNCCNHCSLLYKNTVEAVKELNLDIQVEQENEIINILQYKVMRTPALLINEKLVSEGETLSVKKIINLIKENQNL